MNKQSEGQRSVDVILRNVREIPVMRRTEPSRRLFDPSKDSQLRYVPSDKMDVRIPVAQFNRGRV